MRRVERFDSGMPRVWRRQGASFYLFERWYMIQRHKTFSYDPLLYPHRHWHATIWTCIHVFRTLGACTLMSARRRKVGLWSGETNDACCIAADRRFWWTACGVASLRQIRVRAHTHKIYQITVAISLPAPPREVRASLRMSDAKKMIKDFGIRGSERVRRLLDNIESMQLDRTMTEERKETLLAKVRGSDDGCNQAVASAITKLAIAKGKKLNKKERESVQNTQVVLLLAPEGEITCARVKAFMLATVTKTAPPEHIDLWNEAIEKIVLSLDDVLSDFRNMQLRSFAPSSV